MNLNSNHQAYFRNPFLNMEGSCAEIFFRVNIPVIYHILNFYERHENVSTTLQVFSLGSEKENTTVHACVYTHKHTNSSQSIKVATSA